MSTQLLQSITSIYDACFYFKWSYAFYSSAIHTYPSWYELVLCSSGFTRPINHSNQLFDGLPFIQYFLRSTPVGFLPDMTRRRTKYSFIDINEDLESRPDDLEVNIVPVKVDGSDEIDIRTLSHFREIFSRGKYVKISASQFHILHKLPYCDCNYSRWRKPALVL